MLKVSELIDQLHCLQQNLPVYFVTEGHYLGITKAEQAETGGNIPTTDENGVTVLTRATWPIVVLR
jgi:hypothetical protein